MNDHIEVELVRWPSERGVLERARTSGRPRLLLVEAGAPTPDVVDELEDWVRLPASDEDVAARIRTLQSRARRHDAGGMPTIDDDGVITRGIRSVSVGSVAAALAHALFERHGAVVSREELMRAAWPDGNASRNMLDVQIKRLRSAIEPLGIGIATVRSRGYRIIVDDVS